MNRILDIMLAVFAIVILAIPMLVIAAVIKLTSKGTVLHFSKRVGQDNKIFLMPKFRTMVMQTPDVATDLLTEPERYVTPVGKTLRKYSLDELPQLWSILKNDMSFVGPRPALHNQQDLIAKRTEKGVHELLPGLTGLAQINGRDENSVEEKVELDQEYLKNRCLRLDIQILFGTINRVTSRTGVSH